jgi:hypothetical protein
MPTAPPSPSSSSAADSDEVQWVLLRFLPKRFVRFLDEKLGKLIADNGGFAHWEFDVRRGAPYGFEATETFKADAWEDKAS